MEYVFNAAETISKKINVSLLFISVSVNTASVSINFEYSSDIVFWEIHFKCSKRIKQFTVKSEIL